VNIILRLSVKQQMGLPDCAVQPGRQSIGGLSWAAQGELAGSFLEKLWLFESPSATAPEPSNSFTPAGSGTWGHIHRAGLLRA